MCAALILVLSLAATPGGANAAWQEVDSFSRPDGLYAGDAWESLNPGYWKIQDGALRRRLSNRGDRARATGFPYHWETHEHEAMPMAYDPSLPFGMMWRRDWRLGGSYRIRARFLLHDSPTPDAAHPDWRQNQPGYGLLGLCFGGATLFESWHGNGEATHAAWMAAWRNDGHFGIYDHHSDTPDAVAGTSEQAAPLLRPGDRVSIEVAVVSLEPGRSWVTASLVLPSGETLTVATETGAASDTNGFFGLVARGLLDFAVETVEILPGANTREDAPVNDLHVCYPLGDTLRLEEDGWHCKFVALFRSEGGHAALRIAGSEAPAQGWSSVPVAGQAPIVNNEFRLNTAVIDAHLPGNPADTTQYYTVWKEEADVTGDPRTGFLGQKSYVGRLPRLEAPYRIAGLGGHAIHGGGPNLDDAGIFGVNWVHEQPTPDAYKYLEEYDLQVLLWDDDVWYLELLIYPPSIDDAYKIITETIAGPTGRWAMMRHWNVINPGDHDHGMDDVKGPEQYQIRQQADLGQDPEYMRRNFQIVSHLVQGDEAPSGVDNPKRWRRWKMPDRDFSLLIMDARLWRTSQDTRIWDDEGWGHKANVYDRTDPTRTLLGEEQFAWLETIIRTDSSPLICVSGINCLHTIWSGVDTDPVTGQKFSQRDRVAADYAGWVKSGADRVIELLGSRQGVVTVFGDIHLASIVENTEQRLIECSFGPIGRTGSRAPKEGFGPEMTDYDGRPVRVHAVYHDAYGTPDLQPREGPKIWNFLEMQYDPRGQDPGIDLRIRNLVDPPGEASRGGGFLATTASQTGRPPASTLPSLSTLANADVYLTYTDGRPVRGTRSLADGNLPRLGLPGVPPGTTILVTVQDGSSATTALLTTLASEPR